MQPLGHERHPILSMFPSPLVPLSPCALLPPPPPHTPHFEYFPTSYAAGLSCPQHPNSEQGGEQCRAQENHLLRGREGGGREGGEGGGWRKGRRRVEEGKEGR